MLIVNPNFAVDRTIPLDMMLPGAVHRTGSATTSLGGKGVNVARVARALGGRGALVGFVPSASAKHLAMLAAAENAELDGVHVAGVVRAASILLEQSGRVSVFNEPGPAVDAAAWQRLLDEIASRAPYHETVVCSGSLPPGSPADAYGRVVSLARRMGLRSVVDATGTALEDALDARPDVVSPNLAEAESLVSGPATEGVEASGEMVAKRATAAVRTLVARGAQNAIVSAGRYGAAFSWRGDSAFCSAPAVAVVNPIGAGDSLVGGLVHALERRDPWEAAVRFAVAVASASCEQPGVGAIDLARINELSIAPGNRSSVPISQLPCDVGSLSA